MYDLQLLAAIKTIAKIQAAHHEILMDLIEDPQKSAAIGLARNGISNIDRILNGMIDPEQISSLDEELNKHK